MVVPLLLHSGYRSQDRPRAICALLGRDLTIEERSHFEDSELVNRQIGYQIVHREGKEGNTFANVENIWPLRDTTQNRADKEVSRF